MDGTIVGGVLGLGRLRGLGGGGWSRECRFTLVQELDLLTDVCRTSSVFALWVSAKGDTASRAVGVVGFSKGFSGVSSSILRTVFFFAPGEFSISGLL